MKTRRLGKTGLDVAEIGLGTEFLLGLSEKESCAVVHSALDNGINYVDMFWAQPEFRDHMGRALRGRRNRIAITAHLGSTLRDGQYAISRDLATCRSFFEDDLRRLGTDHVDVLFLHNCNDPADYDAVMRDGLLDLAVSFVREGKARFVGYSGHNVMTAKQAVESGDIDVLMFPINLASYAVPGKPDLLEAIDRERVGLVAMKVFGGGSLLRDKSTIEMQDFQMGRQQMPGAPSHYTKPAKITAVQCMAYVLDQLQVSTIVPGCKNVEELEGVLTYVMAADEDRDYSHILPAFDKFATGECVYCNHCLPCPSTIDIGKTISLFEQAKGGMTEDLRANYRSMETDASDCIKCGQCSKRCPFGVDVVSKMEQAAQLFATPSTG